MLLMLLGLSGCGTKEMDSADTLNEQESDSNTLDSDVDPKSATEMFRVPERPWDLALSPESSILSLGEYTVHLGSGHGNTHQFERAVYDVQNILFDDDGTLYFTTTDNGVTGGLSMWQDNQPVLLHTQADDGTLMRWPMDFVKGPNEEWIIADFQQGLFVVDPSGTVTTKPSGANKPQGLLFLENTLFVSGDDGIFSMEYPMVNRKIDDRSGLALISQRIRVVSNAEQGVFIVDSSPVGLKQAARPGSLLNTSDGIYFADHVGEGLVVRARIVVGITREFYHCDIAIAFTFGYTLGALGMWLVQRIRKGHDETLRRG